MFKFFVSFLILLPLIVWASNGAVIAAFGETIRDIYNILFIVGAGLATLILVWGGIRLGFSLGSPPAIIEAKKWIFSAFIGLTIILGSRIILGILDPRFAIWEPEIIVPAPPPIPEIVPLIPPPFDDGIVFYIKSINQADGSENGDGDASANANGNEQQLERIEISRGIFRGKNLERTRWNGKFKNFEIKEIKFKNPKDLRDALIQQYGIIAFEEPGFRGRCQIITKNTTGLLFRPLSVRSFVMPGASHYRSGDKLIFFQENYPFRFRPKPPQLDTKTADQLKAEGYRLNIKNIPDTIIKLAHKDHSNILEQIKPEQNVPLNTPIPIPTEINEMSQGLFFIDILMSYMRFKTNEVGKYLIVLFDHHGHCYLAQESIVDLRDIRRRLPGMKYPFFFQSIQILRLY